MITSRSSTFIEMQFHFNQVRQIIVMDKHSTKLQLKYIRKVDFGLKFTPDLINDASSFLYASRKCCSHACHEPKIPITDRAWQPHFPNHVLVQLILSNMATQLHLQECSSLESVITHTRIHPTFNFHFMKIFIIVKNKASWFVNHFMQYLLLVFCS